MNSAFGELGHANAAANCYDNLNQFSAFARGLEERLYVQQDANWNVTAVVNTSGSIQERYVEHRTGARKESCQ